jgi:TPR repeat protein
LRKSAHYYKVAADQEHADAQFYYGFCLGNSRGVQIDLQKSVHYYIGHPDALLNLGRCLEYGKGIPQHPLRDKTLKTREKTGVETFC